MRAVFFLTSLSCGLYVILGLFTIFRASPADSSRRLSLDVVFGLLCIMLSLGTFGTAFFISSANAKEALDWYRRFAFTWYLSPGLFLLFIVLFAGFKLKPAILIMIMLPGFVLTFAQVWNPVIVVSSVAPVQSGWHTRYSPSSPWMWLNIANNVLPALASIFVLVRTIADPVKRRIRTCTIIILASSVTTFGGSFILGFAVRAFGIGTLPPMLPVFLTLLVIGLAVALFRYDFLVLTPSAAADRILASVSDAVVLADPNGYIIHSNLEASGPGAVSVGAGTVPRKHIGDLIGEVGDPVVWLSECAGRDGEPVETEFFFGPGLRVPAAAVVHSISTPDGCALGYIVTAHNLSAERGFAAATEGRAEASSALHSLESDLSQAFRASPAGMLMADLRTQVILQINAAGAKICGAQPAELHGKKVGAVIDLLDETELDSMICALSDGRTVDARGIAISRVDGTKLDCIMSASPMDYEGKKVALLFLLDVTELNRLRNQLVRDQNLESIGMLAGGIAHDFNNILTAIMGNVSLARLSVAESDSAFPALSSAEAACFRARELSRQLLTFAKGGDPSLQATDILSLAREATRLAVAGSEVVATVFAESDLPAAYIDSGQILQVFHNIVLNAVQAMRGGGRLQVRLRSFVKIASAAGSTDRTVPAYLGDGEYVVADFEDEGPGIDPVDLERVFDPFFTTKKDASGLGLAISYSIVKRHGGGISVTSDQGKGTGFTVYLPSAGRDTETEAKRDLSFGKGSVLVMDDEQPIRVMVDRMLRRLGYDPAVYPNGETAFDAFRKAHDTGRSFSAIILDLTVPGGMGGLETARLIRELDPSVPLYVSSGYSDSSVFSDFANFGFDGAIPKPYGMEELMRMLSGSH